MPANGVDHEEPRPNHHERMRTAAGSIYSHEYDRFFYDIFYSVTLVYARKCPSSLRRLIELIFLLKAVFSFIVLVFVHMNFGRTPAGCLDHVKDVWPRDGVLRVEIIRDWQRTLAGQTGTLNDLYTVDKSYEREYKFRPPQKNDENASMFLNSFTKTNDYQNKGDFDIESSVKEFNGNRYQENVTSKYNFLFDYIMNTDSVNEKGAFDNIYIVEYSFDEAFLKLSQNTRKRLDIPVMFVSLEPTRHKCFGDSTSQFFLEYFLGYDQILMSSVLSLAKNEHYKGYMRNVNTDSYYIFVYQWTGRTLYIVSFYVMIVFAVIISTILRYGQHRVFFIIVHLLQRPLNGSLFLLVVQLFVAVLVLFSSQYTMLNFFKGYTKWFWIALVLIIWIAERYDTISSNCLITKKHWLKFFYLYLFSFFAYHYRFKGEYSHLALICSWFFIQHSMLYFYHHYELPIVLEHDHLLQEIFQREQQQQQLLQQQQQLLQWWQQLSQLQQMTFQREERRQQETGADDSETTAASAVAAASGAASSDSVVPIA